MSCRVSRTKTTWDEVEQELVLAVGRGRLPPQAAQSKVRATTGLLNNPKPRS